MIKKYFFILILITILKNLSPAYPEISIDSKITAVTVYNNLAQITREAQTIISNGTSIIIFKKLPVSIIDNSVIVKIDNQAVILDVKIEKQYLVESRQKIVRDIEKEIKKLQEEDRILIDKLSSIKKSIKLLDSLNNITEIKLENSLLNNKINTSEWMEVINFSEKNNIEKLEQIRNIEKNRESISTNILYLESKIASIVGYDYINAKNRLDQNIQRQVQNLAVQAPAQSRDFDNYNQIFTTHIKGDKEKWVKITIQNNSTKKYNCVLEYNLPGAYWDTLYDIRAYPSKPEIEITLYGMINQKTGEDWENISLFLSSSRPTIQINPPTLSYWKLNKGSYRGSVNITKYKSASMAAPSAAMDNSELLENEISREPIYQQTPPVSIKKGLSVLFPIKAKATVKSSSEKEKYTIDTFNLKQEQIQLKYLSIPDKSSKIFLYTTITNYQPYPLLNGRANIYVDADYIGAGNIPDVNEKNGFQLYLGTDEEIKIKKSLVKKYTEYKGNDIIIIYQYRIKVENQKSKEIELLVKDNIPVSMNEDIKVKIIDISPPPIEDKEETESIEYKNGVRKFKLLIDSMSDKEINYTFSIKYNKDENVYPLR